MTEIVMTMMFLFIIMGATHGRRSSWEAGRSLSWVFWVAPLIGGALGGIVYRWISEEPSTPVTGSS